MKYRLTWNEQKRTQNLDKHHLGFADAGLVLNSQFRLDVESIRNNEQVARMQYGEVWWVDVTLSPYCIRATLAGWIWSSCVSQMVRATPTLALLNGSFLASNFQSCISANDPIQSYENQSWPAATSPKLTASINMPLTAIDPTYIFKTTRIANVIKLGTSWWPVLLLLFSVFRFPC